MLKIEISTKLRVTLEFLTTLNKMQKILVYIKQPSFHTVIGSSNINSSTAYLYFVYFKQSYQTQKTA